MVYIKDNELEIKAISQSDGDAVIALLTDDAVKQTYMLPDFADRAQAGALFGRLRELSAGEESFVAGIYLRGEFIGIINETEKGTNFIELGYALLPQYHKRGYCSRALRKCIEYFFEKGLEKVICGAFEENSASIRVMEKCEMAKQDKTEEIEYRGRVHRCVYYAACR